MKNSSMWQQHIKFTHTPNHVGNVIIVADITLENFSQIEQSQQIPCLIECHDENNIILQKRETTLSTVQEYINKKLDPKKVNVLNIKKANYKKVPSITDILCELGITEDDALSISSDEYFQIYLKRGPNACFINNYFTKGVIA